MKIVHGILTVFLVFGLLGVPSSVFAEESSFTGSDCILKYSTPVFMDNDLNPQVKGGGRGGGSSGSKSSYKKIKDGDDVDDNSTDDDDGSGWLTTIIILIVIIAIIAIAVWYFFLRK